MHHLSTIGDDSVPADGSAASVPKAVSQGGPVIDSRDGAVQTVRPPDRTMALTFDDRPDPVWTPQILDVLREHNVHATFFVVGTEAIENPGLVRRIGDEGHEIGVHALTHADLGIVPGWQRQLEERYGSLSVPPATQNQT